MNTSYTVKSPDELVNIVEIPEIVQPLVKKNPNNNNDDDNPAKEEKQEMEELKRSNKIVAENIEKERRKQEREKQKQDEIEDHEKPDLER